MLGKLLILILSLGFVLDEVHAEQGNDISSSSSLTISCKDEVGNNVDWFIAYKLPKIPDSPDALFQQGSGYFFLLPGQSNGWERSKLGIHEPKSILGVTTQPLYSSSNNMTDLAYFLYNDQPPNLPAVVRDGHTKGIVVANTQGGIWLPHSCPHFINQEGPSFAYPPGGLENGQMFFCLSMNISQIDEIGNILKYTRPKVYGYSASDSMKSLVPTLLDVAQNQTVVKKAPWFNTFLMGTHGLPVTVFAKAPKFRREIYSNWIAPKYQSSLDVQSWLNGAHPLQSDCLSDKFSTLNVLDKSISGQNFSKLDDHSKWAVGTDQNIPVTCVGDLNRMKPQKGRGGVAICALNSQIWSAFKSSVADVEPCKKPASQANNM